MIHAHIRKAVSAALIILAASLPVQAAPVIKVLSNRADLVSGGEALVEIIYDTPDKPANARVKVERPDGSEVDVTGAFAVSEGRHIGLVEGLGIGENKLRVTGLGGGDNSVTITNHSNEGPIFSAAQHRLLSCAERNALGLVPIDAPDQCNDLVNYRLLFKPARPVSQSDFDRGEPSFTSGLLPYDPATVPDDDVAVAKLDSGESMPFIVREESGYQDRDRYKILTLVHLDENGEVLPWSAMAPQAHWNRKLLITHGGNCGIGFRPGSPRLSDYSGTIPENPALEQSYLYALGKGYMVGSTALDNTGHNCDVALGAESLMMLKERIVEQYGELDYTMGTGCSGGSIAQATIANAYPGIYQGLITMCAYPDSFSPGAQFADYHGMRRYFENPQLWSPDATWVPTQWGLVEGHLSHVNAVAADEGLFKGATNPEGGCANGIEGFSSYNRASNHTGVRCSIIDWMSHILGRKQYTINVEGVERAITAAPLPIGSTGIQYGLQALQKGQITPAQFVDLNVKIGGLDIDIKPQPMRSEADADALKRLYRSGMMNVANNLDTVPIINFVGPDPGAAHDSVHAWWVRWRIDREHGHHDNHVMWGGPVALIGDTQYVYQGIDAMDRWLTAISEDESNAPLSEKITNNRPYDIHDQCSDGAGNKLLDEICVEFLRYPYAYGTPRTIAGDKIYASNLECQLRPMNREDDYGPVPLTDAQWEALQEVFPTGVCDYRKRGLGEEQKTVTWLDYLADENDPTDQILRINGRDILVGGKQLPAIPENSRDGWSHPVFQY